MESQSSGASARGAGARRPFFRRRKSCPFSGPNAPNTASRNGAKSAPDHRYQSASVTNPESLQYTLGFDASLQISIDQRVEVLVRTSGLAM